MKIKMYSSLTEKESRFESVNIDNKNDIDDLIKKWSGKNSNKQMIFRGLSEAKYKLINSAQRYWIGEELDKFGGTYKTFVQKEIEIAKNFQNRLLIKFYNAFGHTAYDLSILSFLQHYGAPTPLLDFTYNFDCALFFGIDKLTFNPSKDIDNYFSIYAIDTNQNEFISLYTHLEENVSQIDSFLDENENKDFNIDATEVLNQIKELQYGYFDELKLFYLPGYIPNGIRFKMSNRPNFKLVYNQHNLNVINQEGLFVFHSDPTRPLEDYFTGNSRSFQPTFQLHKIKCWNIHKNLKEHIEKHLIENLTPPINKEFIYPQEEFIAASAFKQFKKS